MNRPGRGAVHGPLAARAQQPVAVPCVVALMFTLAAVAFATPALAVGRVEIHRLKSRALGAERTVRVWLPPGFDRRHHYSVFYLNDGQNLFAGGDPDLGAGGWHADETAARLLDRQIIVPLIIVGIDNAGDASRRTDYVPVPETSGPETSRPETSGLETSTQALDAAPSGADRYLAFVIDELMPFIARRYPVLDGPRHAGFGGSSYGAVSALYAVMSRPRVFGRVLLESPSAGIGGGVLLDRARTITEWPERVAMGVGTGEGGGRGSGAFQTLADLLRHAGLGDDRLMVVVQAGGRHNEASWAARFPDALAFLFGRDPGAPPPRTPPLARRDRGSAANRVRPRARVRLQLFAWNITSPSTISSRARWRSSTSRSSSGSIRARRPRRRSSAGCAAARI